MSPHPQARAALIIPALNEEQSIGRALAEIPSALYSQILVVDNGSTDRTAAVAVAAGATVVSEPRRGYGSACLRGIAALDPATDVVVFMDADSSDVPAEAAAMVQPIAEGRADLVLGSRTRGQSEAGALLPHQRFGNWLATTLIRLLYGHRYTDLGPFRAIRASSLRQLDMRDPGYGWTIEMQIKALRNGLRVLEVPVSYRRRIGTSKISGTLRASLAAGAKILWTVLRLLV
ncbi:MAG: glycosyltransferase family 2 protein [Acidobacteria bacterium]|nr:glycosyltransferase family 2 protein [Acidobacteriota bacterium]